MPSLDGRVDGLIAHIKSFNLPREWAAITVIPCLVFVTQIKLQSTDRSQANSTPALMSAGEDFLV
jgi:hypothetical protein